MRDTPAQNSHGTGEDESLRFSQVLRRLADAPEERLSVHNLVEAFGERAFGALMLCVGLLNMLPWPPGQPQRLPSDRQLGRDEQQRGS
jgi:hypothetical protein